MEKLKSEQRSQFVAAGYAAIDDGDRCYYCRYAQLHIGLAVNILLENEADTIALKIQTT